MYYINGTWVQPEQTIVHPEDRGYQFGDGVYEVIRIYGGKLYQWEGHLARLKRSAAEIKLQLAWSDEELLQIALEIMKRNGFTTSDDANLYMQVTRGASPRSHEFPADAKPVLSANATRKARPLEQMKNGVAAILTADVRWLRCDIKSLNLLGAVLAKQQAKEAGAFEAILHRDGIVTEGSSTNVFAVKDGRLHTHPADNLILNGVTRQTVLELARSLSIPVVEEAFDLAFLKQADELFITSTTAEVMPIITVDGERVGTGQPGQIAQRLQAAFEESIARNSYTYS